MADILMCPLEQYEHSPQYGSIKNFKVIDPFTYWIQCQSCLDWCLIHEKLKEFTHLPRDNDYIPKNDEFVIIQDINGLFYRGCILSSTKEEYFSVFLIDKYNELTVAEADTYYLPQPWKNIKPQGHLIQIYGVLPSPQLNLDVLMKGKPKLEKALQDADDILLEDSCVIDNSTFGSIVIINGSSMYAISEILLKLHFALPSLDFEKDIVALMKLNEKVNLEKKLHTNSSSPTDFEVPGSSNKHCYSYSPARETDEIKISPQHDLAIRACLLGFLLTPEWPTDTSQKPQTQLEITDDSSRDLIFENCFSSFDTMKKRGTGSLPAKSSVVDDSAGSVSNSYNSSFKKVMEKIVSQGTDLHKREMMTSQKTPFKTENNDSYKNTIKGKHSIKTGSSASKRNKACSKNKSSDISSNIELSANTLQSSYVKRKQAPLGPRLVDQTVQRQPIHLGPGVFSSNDVINSTSNIRSNYNSRKTPDKEFHKSHTEHDHSGDFSSLRVPKNSSRDQHVRQNMSHSNTYSSCSDHDINETHYFTAGNVSDSFKKTSFETSCGDFHITDKSSEFCSHSKKNVLKKKHHNSSQNFMKYASTPQGNNYSGCCFEHEISPICDKSLEPKSKKNSSMEDSGSLATHKSHCSNNSFEKDEFERNSSEADNSIKSQIISGFLLNNKQAANKNSSDLKKSPLGGGLGRGKLLQILAARSRSESVSLNEGKTPPKHLHCSNDSKRQTNCSEIQTSFLPEHAINLDETPCIPNSNFSLTCPEIVHKEDNFYKKLNDANYTNDEYSSPFVELNIDNQNYKIDPTKISTNSNDDSKKQNKKEPDLKDVYEHPSQTNNHDLGLPQLNLKNSFKNSPYYSFTAEPEESTSNFKKFTSTPKENNYSGNLRENEISLVNDKCLLPKSADNLSKRESDSLASLEIEVYLSHNNLNHKGEFEKNTSNKKVETNTSGGSLKDERFKNESTYSPLGRGFGRGKLLQKFAESTTTFKTIPVNESEKSPEAMHHLHDLDLHVSCDEIPTSLLPENAQNLDEKPFIFNINSSSSEKENCEKKLSDKCDRNEEDIVPSIKNDHEDRYFDIEPPNFLTCALDKGESLYSMDDSQMEEKNKSCPQHDYEQFRQSNEHKPVDISSLINTVQRKPLQLGQKILSEYSIGKITERMKLACGIIHGNINCQPALTLAELKLDSLIFAKLSETKVTDLTRSQMYAIPVLLQRRNLVLVGPPNSGKTFAYILPILSLLLDGDYYKNIKKGNGPLCVFLTSTSQNANHISQFCSAICGTKLKIITTYGGGLELERRVELTNGCDVLVTTPKCWLRLLKHSSVTNLSRLCHIVFDDADTLLETFLPEVLDIVNQVKKMLHLRKKQCDVDLQLAMVGEKWTPILEECLKFIDSPILCITAHLEAALYARIKPTTYILPPKSKIEKLKELIHSHPQKVRTVIVCQCAEEVTMLRPILELSMSDVLIAHEDMSLSLICDVSNKWGRSTSPPTLLCSDSILGELAVTNAQRLIHFSIPESKSYFSERFSTIEESFHDRIKCPKNDPPDCSVDILVDNTNEEQFPEIVSFMKRLSTPIPKEVLDTVKQIQISWEMRKEDKMICERILMFGKCWKKEKCKERHIFKKSKDYCTNLPQSGMVKVKLLYVHNPSRYSIRILATKANSNDPWENVQSNYFLLGLKMSNYYSDREKRISHGSVNVGDMVAVEVEPDILFKRARVLEIVSRDEKLNPVTVSLHFIDEGSIHRHKAVHLLYIPPELQNFEPESHDLYLTGLQPVDYDPEWSFAATVALRKNLRDLTMTDDHFFVAKIMFTAGRNVIASSLLCYEWLEINRCFIVLFSPKKFILNTGLAVSNNEHLPSILELALEGGIISSDLPSAKEDEDETSVAEEIQWAHLEKNKWFPTCVLYAENPSLLYLEYTYFKDRLSALQKELTNILNDKIIKPDIIRHDMVCAIKNPVDKDWNRAILLEVLDNSEVKVFCVDYGDSVIVPVSDLSLLPKGFVSRLPFQALECSLAGIEAIEGNWSQESVDYLYMLTGLENNPLKPLYAKVCEVKSNAQTTGGHHYQVILGENTNGQEILINKELLYKGFANWDPATKSYLCNCDPIPIVDDDLSEYDDLGEDDGKTGNDEEEVWTPELCNKPEVSECSNREEDKGCLEETEDKGSEEKAIILANKQITDKDDNGFSFNDFIELIKTGDFDFNFSPCGLIESMFFHQNQPLPEMSAPPPSYSLNDSSELHPDSGENISEEDVALQNAEVEKKQDIEDAEDKANDDNVVELENSSFTDINSDSDNESTTSEDINTSLLSKVFESIYYPPIVWNQDDTHVKMRVVVPDITLYEINYSEFKLCFQTCIDSKYYWFDLVFFGPICAESVEYSPKGQYFGIKVEKYLKGEKWPRLTFQDVKYSWIKMDPDSIVKNDKMALSTFHTSVSEGEKLKIKEIASSSTIENPYATYVPADLDSDCGNDSIASDGEKSYDLQELCDVEE